MNLASIIIADQALSDTRHLAGFVVAFCAGCPLLVSLAIKLAPSFGEAEAEIRANLGQMMPHLRSVTHHHESDVR